MSQGPYNGARRDEAEPAVVKAFEAGGATVAKINGRDVPDLLVGYLRETHLVEVKTSDAKLRRGQREFARTWLGSPVLVVRTPAQARRWLKVWSGRAASLAPVLRAQEVEAVKAGAWQGPEPMPEEAA